MLQEYFASDPSVTSSILIDTASASLSETPKLLDVESENVSFSDISIEENRLEAKKAESLPITPRKSKNSSNLSVIKDLTTEIKNSFENKKEYYSNMTKYFDLKSKNLEANKNVEKRILDLESKTAD
jgi:hypothetical protein